MYFVEKVFNASVAGLFWAFLRPFSFVQRGIDLRKKEQTSGLMATLAHESVKVIVCQDGSERVRIIRRDRDFGAVVDTFNQEKGWVPLRLVGAGFVYDSVEAAEAAATEAAFWLGSGEKAFGPIYAPIGKTEERQ